MIKPISALRQRMIDDMMMRNLSPNTQETYIRSVAQFSAFHRRSPDKLGVEHLRDFHLHLVSRGLVANSIGVKMAALRFFYGTTLRRPDIAAADSDAAPDGPSAHGSRTRGGRATAQGGRRSQAANGVLMTIYSAGLRISEVMRLTAQDIDSARMVICVRQGKGRKDRYTVLSGQLLGILRDYWRPDAAIALAVSRPQSIAADDQARAATGMPASRRGRRAEQVGHRPHVAPQFCDPSARTGCRHSRDPGPARTSAHQDDRGLCPRCRRPDPASPEPARTPERGSDSAGLTHRQCRVQSSKWRTSSAATAPLGAPPTRLI